MSRPGRQLDSSDAPTTGPDLLRAAPSSVKALGAREPSIFPVRNRSRHPSTDLQIRAWEPLSRHCSWGIGGPARFVVAVRTAMELSLALREARLLGLPHFLLGKGSNCLFHDDGFDGIVILNQINHLSSSRSGVFTAGSGRSFNQLGGLTSQQGREG
ncbi:hypothetical protein WJX72_011256 [[Myrmecia] bisecta]|uniref:FAD linked oxidase N-terminal domain-containing protein n=1 Tax=[Myrmecia] bisecta TaxID=41462 RepID=A0AAW1R9W9_9CHLO